MNRRSAWLPALAAPIALLGHLLPEALVSGRPLLALAEEPVHLALLALSLGAVPLWLRAARSRRLGLAIFGFIAITLLAEGNGLSAVALVAALAISALISWLGGLALEAAVETAAVPTLAALAQTVVVLPAPVELAGPYFAYVASRGNRPPPPLLAQLALQTAFT
jgi:hypothetical protein